MSTVLVLDLIPFDVALFKTDERMENAWKRLPNTNKKYSELEWYSVNLI